MLTTAVVLGGLTALGLRERHSHALTAAVPQDATTTDLPEGDVVVQALTTTNVYSEPERGSEVVAVLPAGSGAVVEAHSADGEWLRVIAPPDTDRRGWARADVLTAARGELASLPTVSPSSARTIAASADAPGSASLPDLAVAEAFLLEDGRLAVSIHNAGGATLFETIVPVRVTRAEGDIIGVLQIGPTTLTPGARATVVTPVVVSEAGNYQIVIDAGNEIDESLETNNAFAALLIPKG